MSQGKHGPRPIAYKGALRGDDLGVSVTFPQKVLKIGNKTMQLEPELTGASTDEISPEERVLTLEYRGRFSEENSPVINEFDKLRKTYGEQIAERMNISSTMDSDAHYLTFMGRITPNVIRTTRQCYDILEPLESRERGTTRWLKKI